MKMKPIVAVLYKISLDASNDLTGKERRTNTTARACALLLHQRRTPLRK